MKLLALDGNSIINRAYYGIRLLSTKDGIFTNAILGFLNILMKIEDEVKPDSVAIAFDMKGPTFRHKMFDDYKAQRKGMPEELAMQLPLLQELLGYLGYNIVKKEGFEADDILGTLAAFSRKNGNECVIATGDRDSFQLVGDGVSVRLAFTKGGQPQAEIVDSAYIQEKYGVEPKQLIDVKALMGDQSDNIPGVKGIGEKTALELIQKYTSLDYIYENFDEVVLKPAQRKNLTEFKDMAYLSRDLAEIDCNAPIDSNIDTYKKHPVDSSKAYPFMAKLELFSQMDKLGVVPVSDEAQFESLLEEVPIEINFQTIPSELFTKSENIDVLFAFEEKEITAICLLDDKVVYYQTSDIAETVKTILSSDTPKRTNQLKDLWHWAIKNNFELKNVIFDAEIAGYILNPNASDYSLDRLMGEYSITQSGFDNIPTQNFPIISTAINFSALCDRLNDEIEKNNQVSLLHDIELPLTEVLAHMEQVGIAVDSPGIRNFGEKLDITLKEVELRIYEHAGETFNINSPKQLAEILFVKLGLPPKKKTKTGYSTNVDVLESLKNEHPVISDILEYRQYAKLKSTYVDGLLAVVAEDNRIHTTFQQTLTRTGRISSIEPNLQNIPIRTPLGSELRRFFIADEGYTLIDADYSQIELRVLAHISNDQHMIAAFENDEDIHTQTASQVFDMPDAMVTPLMRSRAKAVNFGIIYGIGAFSLSQDIGVKVSEADDYIKNYLDFYKGVDNYMKAVIEKAKEDGYASTMFGRRLYLPELSASNHNVKEFGKRVARNMPIQGTAADIIKIAMIKVFQRLREEGLSSRLVLQVHDELMLECPPEELDRASVVLKEEMETAIKMSVPLKVDVHHGANWYEL